MYQLELSNLQANSGIRVVVVGQLKILCEPQSEKPAIIYTTFTNLIFSVLNTDPEKKQQNL